MVDFSKFINLTVSTHYLFLIFLVLCNKDLLDFQGSLPIYSNRIAVSVIDNILLVHQVDAKVVIIYDMFAESRTPISAPLPLLLRGFSRASESEELSDAEIIIYGDDWSFLVPDLICDVANGFLWKIHLDLEASSCIPLHCVF